MHPVFCKCGEDYFTYGSVQIRNIVFQKPNLNDLSLSGSLQGDLAEDGSDPEEGDSDSG